jgi:anti-sigma regulatory factor (Ser/Thr protein kinase)
VIVMRHRRVSRYYAFMLEPANTSPRLARQRLRNFVGPVSASHVAETVLSELVTNAVVHGHPPIRVELTRNDGLKMKVFDGDPHTDRVAVASAARGQACGRGLRLVEALAHEWGAEREADGKMVWAEVALAEQVTADEGCADSDQC